MGDIKKPYVVLGTLPGYHSPGVQVIREMGSTDLKVKPITEGEAIGPDEGVSTTLMRQGLFSDPTFSLVQGLTAIVDTYRAMLSLLADDRSPCPLLPQLKQDIAQVLDQSDQIIGEMAVCGFYKPYTVKVTVLDRLSRLVRVESFSGDFMPLKVALAPDLVSLFRDKDSLTMYARFWADGTLSIKETPYME